MQIASKRHSAGFRKQIPALTTRSSPRLFTATEQFWQLGAKLRRTLPWQSAQDLPQPLIHRALTEAEALALQTPFPILVLPALAEERVQAMSQWHRRQQDILARSAIVLTA
jgi:hypothetical protein